MDFLKNLRDDQKHEEATPPTAPPPTSTHHDDSLISKLGNAFSGHSEQHAPPPAANPVAKPDDDKHIHHEGGSLFDKIGEAFGGTQPHTSTTSAPTAPPPAPKEHSFLSKVTDTFGDGQHGTTTAAPPVTTAPPEHKEEGILDKLTGAFGSIHHSEPAPPPPPPKKESFVDKIFGEEKKPEPKHEESGLGGIIGKLTGKKEDTPPKQEGLMDKVNGVFGGGAKGEAKEDHLDKAVDFVQEHVFKQGPQHDESAFEQAKDKQIADAIRHGYKSATGHEFFIKEKK